jgi:hypothetical protein
LLTLVASIPRKATFHEPRARPYRRLGRPHVSILHCTWSCFFSWVFSKILHSTTKKF